MMKDTDKQPRDTQAWGKWEGAEFSRHMFINPEALQTLYFWDLGIFMEASSYEYDPSWTPFIALLPSPETGGAGLKIPSF